ncbi:recombinase family protein [Flavobacterium gilvum]|uniref:recombinase family protein n=1 Tax=Flavobacterium gilvum TaxID=1492737 RepID=UPI0009E01B95|nr:recombinase family protein [Flavobacterium gilvum]
MNVVIYTRVSTDEQAQLGFSLRHQEESLRKYCEIKGYKVSNHFQDDYSAKTFNRPEWLKLFEYVKLNKKIVDLVIFTKWDRFSRNSENALTVIRKLNDFGIQVNSIEQPLDLTVPDNKLVLAMYLAIPEVENDKNSARTRDCMRKAQKEGCFVNRAPYGYKGYRIDGKASLMFNEDALIVKKAFEEVAKGIESVDVIRKRLKLNYSCKLEKQQFYNMLRNVVYKGCILIKEYKKEEEQIVVGLHEPIVKEKLFNKVQDILSGRKRNAKLPSLINDDFPIKKNLICPKCGKQITGSKSLGNGGYYFYYHCKSKCGVRYKRDDVHSKLLELIRGISFNKGMGSLYKSVLRDYLKEDVERVKKEAVRFEQELKSIDYLIESAEDKLMSNLIDKDQFDKVVSRYFSKRKQCENQLLSLSVAKDDSWKYINKAVELLCDLENVFNHLSGEGKASFLRIIYPENLIIEKEGFRTNSRNEVVDVLSSVCGDSEDMEIKKVTPKNDFSNLAPPLGLEPRTL